jgi:hypothetical protein
MCHLIVSELTLASKTSRGERGDEVKPQHENIFCEDVEDLYNYLRDLRT